MNDIDTILRELIEIRDIRLIKKIMELCDSLIQSCKDRTMSITIDELKGLQGEIAAYENIRKKMNFILSEKK